MASSTNFHGIALDTLGALPPGSRVLLDAGLIGEVIEHLHRGRQLRVLPDGEGSRPLVVTYDAVEQVL